MATRQAYDFAHWIWRRLPEKRRRDFFHEWTYRFARGYKAANGFSRGSILACGPLSSINGIGWGARAEFRLLASAGLDVVPYDLSHLMRAEDFASYLDEPQRQAIGSKGVALFHVNPTAVSLSYLKLGRRRLHGRYLVGYWTWEIDDLPNLWKRSLDLAHEVWTPSNYCSEILRKHVGAPVYTVPHPISIPPSVVPDRRHFGIPERSFIVLAMCPVSSGLSRKNPVAAIHAFRQAFGDRSDVRLVIKVSHADRYPDRAARIVEAIDGRPNIQLLTQCLSDLDTWRLVSSADAILSLHRAEGFGLVLAQAMALGKPVIATGWSGNADYMNDRNSLPVRYEFCPVEDPEGNYAGVNALWANPDTEHAANHLCRLSDDAEWCRRIGAAAAKSIAAQFSPQIVLNSVMQTGAATFFSPRAA